MPDLRLPVGLFFLIVGVILIIEGVVVHPVRANLPVDLYWGIVLLIFGIAMTIPGWRATAHNVALEREEKPGS